MERLSSVIPVRNWRCDLRRQVWEALHTQNRPTAQAVIKSLNRSLNSIVLNGVDKPGFIGVVHFDRAVACLKEDRDELLTFYDFPAVHADRSRGGL